MERFGVAVKELRIDRKLTQGQLAKELGVLERTVSFWENGKRECDLATLVKICDFFNVSADYLLGRTDY